MKILLPLLCALLLFTHCCFEPTELRDTIEDMVEEHEFFEDAEIDPTLWDRHDFPEGGESHEE